MIKWAQSKRASNKFLQDITQPKATPAKLPAGRSDLWQEPRKDEEILFPAAKLTAAVTAKNSVLEVCIRGCVIPAQDPRNLN